jgi:hypothetical protein
MGKCLLEVNVRRFRRQSRHATRSAEYFGRSTHAPAHRHDASFDIEFPGSRCPLKHHAAGNKQNPEKSPNIGNIMVNNNSKQIWLTNTF